MSRCSPKGRENGVREWLGPGGAGIRAGLGLGQARTGIGVRMDLNRAGIILGWAELALGWGLGLQQHHRADDTGIRMGLGPREGLGWSQDRDWEGTRMGGGWSRDQAGDRE